MWVRARARVFAVGGCAASSRARQPARPRHPRGARRPPCPQIKLTETRAPTNPNQTKPSQNSQPNQNQNQTKPNPTQPTPNPANPNQNQTNPSQNQACPLATYVDYRRAREAGLPLGPAPALDAACGPLLPGLVGPARWPAYAAAGFDEAPELLHAAATDFDGEVFTKFSKDAPWIPKKEVPDGTPVPAWAPDYNVTAWPGPRRRGLALECAGAAALRAQYEAFDWVNAHAGRFPLIQRGP